MNQQREWPDFRTELIVTAGETPKRLDLFLANREPMLSRSALQRPITEGRITINGQTVKTSQKIKPGDRLDQTLIQCDKETRSALSGSRW